MKKIISIFMLCILSVALVACGGESSDSNKTVTEKAEVEDSAEVDGLATSTEKEDTDFVEIEYVDIPEFNKDVSVSETVLLEEKEVVVKVTGITYDDYYAQLHFKIENNSDDTYVLSSGYLGKESVSINGCMISSGYMDVTVAPGETVESVMEFSIYEMKSKGIYEIYEFSIGFGLMVEGDYNNVDRYWPFYVQTSSSVKSNSVSYRDVLQNGIYGSLYDCKLLNLTQDNLYSQNGVSIVSEALIVDEYGNLSLLLELENKSQDNYIVYIDNVYINEILVCDSGFSKDSLNPSTMNIVEMELHRYIGDDSEYGIDEIENISFDVQLRNDSYEEVVEFITVEYPIDFID